MCLKKSCGIFGLRRQKLVCPVPFDLLPVKKISKIFHKKGSHHNSTRLTDWIWIDQNAQKLQLFLCFFVLFLKDSGNLKRQETCK